MIKFAGAVANGRAKFEAATSMTSAAAEKTASIFLVLA